MSSTPADSLTRFSALTREWFAGTFAEPTPAQAQAWAAIADGANTLVIAPTGSGKTLAAFLWAIDRLADSEPRPPTAGTRVLYVSPLKALAVDVERNLRTPLTGITRIAERLGVPAPAISVGVRSGDTPSGRRRELITRPPDILITTPESLFLMLTSAARDTLAEVQTVIVDEVHAVAGTKRGAHLALSLERLDRLSAAPAQRIGLSATVRPPEEVARFLSGQAPTTIVAPPAAKTFDLSVQVPVPDMANLENNTIWPDVEERIVDLIEAHRSRSCSPIRGGWPSDSPRGSTRFMPRGPGSNCRRPVTPVSPAEPRPTSWPAGRRSGRHHCWPGLTTGRSARSSAPRSRTN